jgi:sulfite dehydrogenase (quinone) subunit SoeC
MGNETGKPLLAAQMHPAFSVIFLTTLSGAGQGLFIAAYASQTDVQFRKILFAVSALLAAAGLFASFFHLGRLRPAWRAASQWRTSWLSREVIALPGFIAGALGCAIWPKALWLQALVLAVCLALFVCTGMIYACIKFLQEWATPLTVVNFFLLGTASGFTLAAALAALTALGEIRFFVQWAVGLTVVAAAFRTASLIRNHRIKPKSTLQSAIGVSHGRIRQVTQGFTAGSFNTREFFHGAAASAVRLIRWGFLALTFAIPVLLMTLSLSKPMLLAAFTCQYAGLLMERWFFFAQANHPQNLYYQRIA